MSAKTSGPPTHSTLFKQLLENNIVLTERNSRGCTGELKQAEPEYLDKLLESYLDEAEYQNTTCSQNSPGWHCRTRIGDNSGDESKEFAIIVEYDASERGEILPLTLVCYFAG